MTIELDHLTDALRGAEYLARVERTTAYVVRSDYFDGSRYHVGYAATTDIPTSTTRVVATREPEVWAA